MPPDLRIGRHDELIPKAIIASAQSGVGPSPVDETQHELGSLKPPKPERPVANFDCIPAELRTVARWAPWAYTWRDGKDGAPGRWVKPFFRIDGHGYASSTNPATLTTFEAAQDAYHRGEFRADGLGIAMSDDDRLVGLDFDNVRDPATGEIADWAWHAIVALDSYVEISPSGKGLRVFVFGKKPNSKCKNTVGHSMVEAYERTQFLTVTGHREAYWPRQIEERQEELDAFFARYLPDRETVSVIVEPIEGAATYTDEEVVKSMKASAKAEKIERAWHGDLSDYANDRSSAVFWLLHEIAWFANYASREQVERIFLASPLGESYEKWERLKDSTLDKVFAGKAHGMGREPKRLEEAVTRWGRSAIEVDERLAMFPDTEAGNAERLVHMRGDVLRWNPTDGWLRWRGKHWQPDPSELMLQEMIQIMRATKATADALDDKDRGKSLAAHCRNSEAIARLRAALSVARTDPAIHCAPEDFDTDAWSLNVQDGIIDLKTGELRPHDPTAMCRKIAPTRYDPEATHWASDAMLEVLERDGRAEFLQMIAGQALTNEATKHFYILTGTSGTAKSTFVDALVAALGDDYVAIVDPSTLIASKDGPAAGGPRADLINLNGKRLAVSAELPNGGALDAQTVKTLSGRDPVPARALYSNKYVTIIPGHTMIVHTNHEP